MNVQTATPIFKVWADSLDQAFQGIGYVVTGCTPTAHGTGTLQVDIASGTYFDTSTRRTYTGGNVIPTAANGSNPRRDLVYFPAGGGAPLVAAGTPAATPLPPAIPANGCPIAILFIPAGATDYSTGFPGAGVMDIRIITAATPSAVYIGGSTLQGAEALALTKTIDVTQGSSQYGAYLIGNSNVGAGSGAAYQTMRADLNASNYTGTGLSGAFEGVAVSEGTGTGIQTGTIAILGIAHGANSATTSTYQTGVSGQARWATSLSMGVSGLGLNTNGVSAQSGARVIGVYGRGQSSGASNGMSGGVFVVGASDVSIATVVPGAALIADTMGSGLNILELYNNSGTPVFKVAPSGLVTINAQSIVPGSDKPASGHLGQSDSVRWNNLYLGGQIRATSANTAHDFWSQDTNPGVRISSGGAGAPSIGSVISVGNADLIIYATGSGTLRLRTNGPSGTDALLISNATVITIPGTLTAGGLATNGLQIATSGPVIYSGSGAPTISAAVKGSLYLRTDGTTTATRAYIATDTVGGWTAITTAA